MDHTIVPIKRRASWESLGGEKLALIAEEIRPLHGAPCFLPTAARADIAPPPRFPRLVPSSSFPPLCDLAAGDWVPGAIPVTHLGKPAGDLAGSIVAVHPSAFDQPRHRGSGNCPK
jgi:hypothetical protein